MESEYISSTAEFYKDKLVNIYFHFIRPKGEQDIFMLAKIYEELLSSLGCSIAKSIDENNEEEASKYKYLLKMLYKMIAQTRDLCYGKGERDITYMMIYTWWKYYPILGLRALHAMMFSDSCWGVGSDRSFKMCIDKSHAYVPHQNSYGCFKDMKYFCNFVKKYGDTNIHNSNNILCKYAMIMLNQRIYDDYVEYCKNGTLPSLACKWVPRENSKYDWIFEKMAIQWGNATHPHILSSVNIEQYDNMAVSFKNMKAVTKCKMIYRKVISQLSKMIDLPETKQCQNKWSDIDPSKITIDAMFRKSNALFNIDNTLEYREHTAINKDRRQCATNMKDHIYMAELSPLLKLEKFKRTYINQCTFTPVQFVKQAIKLIKCKNSGGTSSNIMLNIMYQIGLLNDNWKNFSKKCNALDYFIPIIDISSSMFLCDDAICNAIGMGCLIAEKSKIGQRIMIMDNIPTWVNLDGCDNNFVEMVEILYSYTNKNTVANILKTMDVIIQSLCYSENYNDVGKENDAKYLGNEKKDLVFVIFTNQTSFWKYENEMIHPIIIDRFIKANVNIPHIVYWNCSVGNSERYNNEDVFIKPAHGLTPRLSLVSGINAELLNYFSFIGWNNKYTNTAFETVENILNSSRYNLMDDLFETYY